MSYYGNCGDYIIIKSTDDKQKFHFFPLIMWLLPKCTNSIIRIISLNMVILC